MLLAPGKFAAAERVDAAYQVCGSLTQAAAGLLGGFDGDFLGTSFCGNWGFQRQHAVLEFRSDLFRIDFFGQVDRAEEVSMGEFADINLALFLLVFGLRQRFLELLRMVSLRSLFPAICQIDTKPQRRLRSPGHFGRRPKNSLYSILPASTRLSEEQTNQRVARSWLKEVSAAFGLWEC